VDILERIIENLSSDEVRRFKILSNRFKADEEKKLIVLFDAIRAGGFKEIEDEVVTQLYQKNTPKTKNSYYRLRNKLLSNLEKSLLFYHFNYRNTLEAHSHIQLATLLKERGLYKEAFHYLKKAEKVASTHDQFSVMEVVYDEMVQLAARDINIGIDAIIEKRKVNLKKMEIQRSTNEILGMVAQKANRLSVSRGRKGASLIEMLEQIKDKLEVYKDIYHSPSGQISVARTVCAILLRKGAYVELEKVHSQHFCGV
jgi:tetratricopeptide (TPR) repeat protein